jgi:16S rRNA (guanine966-N2)-methyltransferase
MPRVVAGRFRGIILDAPKGDNTRPTGDKVKEALFSIIQTRVPECDFADIFAGTGGIGIEALSRGANSVVLVEKAGQACAVIKNNLAKLSIDKEDNIELIKMGFVSDIDEKEIGNFKDVIRTAEVCFRTDPAVVMIVREEIQPYFEGQKSIEQVIDIVKNRTKLYLSERTK